MYVTMYVYIYMMYVLSLNQFIITFNIYDLSQKIK